MLNVKISNLKIRIIQQQSNNKEITKLETASHSLLIKQSIEKKIGRMLC